MLIVSESRSQTIVAIPQAPTLIASSDRQMVLQDAPPALLILSHGEQGPPGISPTGADKYYEHVQAVPASVWTITHNLAKKPAISVIDSAGEVVEGDPDYLSDNAVTLTFTAPFSGIAVFN